MVELEREQVIILRGAGGIHLVGRRRDLHAAPLPDSVARRIGVASHMFTYGLAGHRRSWKVRSLPLIGMPLLDEVLEPGQGIRGHAPHHWS